MKTMYLIAAILFVLVFIQADRAMDKHFNDQDEMLCESAKVSGNEKWLSKCECFYEGNDITCIYEK